MPRTMVSRKGASTIRVIAVALRSAVSAWCPAPSTNCRNSQLKATSGAFTLYRIDPGDGDRIFEKVIEGGQEVIGGASFVIIEASIGRQDLCSRAALLEKCGFRMFDICDNAYYFGQLALVDLVMINNRLRNQEIKFKPWQYTEGKVVWSKWQHGFGDHVNEPVTDPFAED